MSVTTIISKPQAIVPAPGIKQLARRDRPREKLFANGADHLTDQELLQVVIGSGVPGADVVYIADAILAVLRLRNGKPSLKELTAIKGVNRATAGRLVACLKLTERFNYTGRLIEDEDDVLALLADIRYKQQEHFVALTLDGAQRLIERRVISVGTLNASLVHPREVFADAVTDRAAAIVVAHNHPGGSLAPSGPDLVVTKRLRAAGELLGIKVLDHFIVTPTGHCIIEV